MIHTFLDRDWNPKIKILNTFLSAFVMRISYFRVKKLQEALSKEGFFLSNYSRSIWVSTNPEFYADFRSDEIIQKNAPKIQ
jgi:hypothetical protein